MLAFTTSATLRWRKLARTTRRESRSSGHQGAQGAEEILDRNPALWHWATLKGWTIINRRWMQEVGSGG